MPRYPIEKCQQQQQHDVRCKAKEHEQKNILHVKANCDRMCNQIPLIHIFESFEYKPAVYCFVAFFVYFGVRHISNTESFFLLAKWWLSWVDRYAHCILHADDAYVGSPIACAREFCAFFGVSSAVTILQCPRVFFFIRRFSINEIPLLCILCDRCTSISTHSHANYTVSWKR